MLAWFIQSKKAEQYSDDELLYLYKSKGDNYFFGELFQRYTHLLYGVCLKYLKNETESKDAVMEIFERTLEKTKTQEVFNFKGWLYSVAKNHCLMALRKQKSQNGKKAEFEKDFKINMEFEQELHLPIENEELNPLNLSEVLTQLNEEQKKCIELFYLENKSYKEVAALTGYDINEVKSFLQNGKRNLKSILTNKAK